MDKVKIKRVRVEKLFGVYDYILQSDSSVNNNLIFLYGDNGTGKSTILKIIYYLLSDKKASGHKTKIANIPFKSFKIDFDNGDYLYAIRKSNENHFLGGFVIEYRMDGTESSVNLKARMKEDDTWFIRIKEDGIEITRRYYAFLSKLSGLKTLYISDNRKEIDSQEGVDGVEYSMINPMERRLEKKEENIEKEIRLLQDWIVNRALVATKKGEEGTSDLYVKIIDQFLKKNKEANLLSIADIKKQLKEIECEVTPYVEMGFMSETDFKDLIQRVDKMKDNSEKQVEFVNTVIAPYMEIQRKKIDALDTLVDTITHFTKSLSGYLFNKKVTYSVANGFVITHTKTSDKIDFKDLSSGEKQLILLFSKVIRKSSECSLILIDEPEISLNIKWQRMLMDSLQILSSEHLSQFIIATHSFEILSKHKENIVQLVNNPVK